MMRARESKIEELAMGNSKGKFENWKTHYKIVINEYFHATRGQNLKIELPSQNVENTPK